MRAVKKSVSKRVRLPPMHALAALDAFAQWGSVGRAADMLGVTRSAVSHRLAMLETIVGFDVVTRSGKGAALTSRGKRYAQDIHRSLGLLVDAQLGSSDGTIVGTLRVSCVPGFASMWLCNHIGSFHTEHPKLRIEITTSRILDDVSDSEVDVFIAYGDGHWPSMAVTHLYNVGILPLCSPTFLSSREFLSQPRDLLRFPLLHLEGQVEWRRWFKANEVTYREDQVGITFSDMTMVQLAATAGQGIMIGDEVTCADAIAQGRLVCPFPIAVDPLGGYYLVTREQAQHSPPIVAFTRWLTVLIARFESLNAVTGPKRSSVSALSAAAPAAWLRCG